MWKGISTSSEEESLSPTNKKPKFNRSLMEFEALSESHKVASVVNMADSTLAIQCSCNGLAEVIQSRI